MARKGMLLVSRVSPPDAEELSKHVYAASASTCDPCMYAEEVQRVHCAGFFWVSKKTTRHHGYFQCNPVLEAWDPLS